MYSDLVNTPYSQARVKFPQYVGADSAKRIISLKNTPDIDSYSSESDLVLFYSVIEDSTPLLIVERLQRKLIRLHKLKKYIKKLQRELEDYNATVQISADRKFIDIVLLKKNVYERLMV